MKKPVLSYNAPLGGDGRWTHAGGYSIWSATVDQSGAVPALWEKSGETPAPLPAAPYVLHNIAAGTPHRLAHTFGFWRISEGDTIFLKTTDGPKVNYTLALTTGAPQYRFDRIAWYCRGCASVLHDAEFETKRFGLDAFWSWALQEVRSFNTGTRTCARCGEAHPFGYGLPLAGDTPDERSARRLW